MSWLRSRILSFSFAFRGLFLLLKEANFQIHTSAVLVVTVAGLYFSIDRNEWIMILLCFAAVMASEALNTALEKALDRIHPDRHPEIAKAKDLAAAGVLICALISALIGLMIFLPYLGFDLG